MAQRRFLSQDVPYWLNLCSEIGARAGISTLFINLTIFVPSTSNITDYGETGRNLKSLGLARASIEDILQAINRTEGLNSGPSKRHSKFLSQLVKVYGFSEGRSLEISVPLQSTVLSFISR